MNERKQEKMHTRLIKKKILQTLILSVIVILFAQIDMNIFTDYFMISIGAICLAAYPYLLGDVAILPIAVISAAGVFGTRALTSILSGGDPSAVDTEFLPETLFYIAYGIGLFLVDKLRNHEFKLIAYIPQIIVIDFVSNEFEFIARMQGQLQNLNNFHYPFTLLIIAIIRGLILALLLSTLDRYGIMLLNRHHAERYQRLILLISTLSGEVLWMKKNVAQIEKTMSTAYRLYGDLKDDELGRYSDDALTVAKDVHEIKKEYMLIMRGLSESMEHEIASDEMRINEIFLILSQAVQDESIDSGKRPVVSFSAEDDMLTEQPYLFLSVFHNLLANSVEACRTRRCVVNITEHSEADDIVFKVEDNGNGIPAQYMNHIFDPGFSTKFNEITGVVNRGLGLSIVKGIVENELHGSISCANGANGGAVFTIRIPKSELEVRE